MTLDPRQYSVMTWGRSYNVFTLMTSFYYRFLIAQYLQFCLSSFRALEKGRLCPKARKVFYLHGYSFILTVLPCLVLLTFRFQRNSWTFLVKHFRNVFTLSTLCNKPKHGCFLFVVSKCFQNVLEMSQV